MAKLFVLLDQKNNCSCSHWQRSSIHKALDNSIIITTKSEPNDRDKITRKQSAKQYKLFSIFFIVFMHFVFCVMKSIDRLKQNKKRAHWMTSMKKAQRIANYWNNRQKKRAKIPNIEPNKLEWIKELKLMLIICRISKAQSLSFHTMNNLK